jgi:hypothetical protein
VIGRAFWKLAANLLSAHDFSWQSWFAVYASGNRRPALLGPIALAGAASDFADERLARLTGSADEFGRWLDAIADIVFVLTALTCEAHAGSIPTYIPILIALSFAQYAFDSIVILGSAKPPRPLRRRHELRSGDHARMRAAAPLAAPLIGILYLAAIIEPAVSYRPSHPIIRRTRFSNSLVSLRDEHVRKRSVAGE